jgi:DUF4097 and DUF4098 domain-containing protein YvlB
MNSKLKILLIVGLIVFVCGGAVAAAGGVMGGVKSVAVLPGGPKIIDPLDESQIERVDKSFDGVTSIDVKLGYMDSVTVKAGAGFSVKGQNHMARGGLKAELGADGKLTVKHSSKYDSGILGLITFPDIFHTLLVGRTPSSLDTNNASVEITVPENAIVAALGLDLAFGSVAVDSVSADRVSVDLASGDAAVKEVSAGAFNVGMHFGDLDAENVHAGEASFESTSGDMELKGVGVTGELRIDSSFGNVKLNTASANTARIDIASGELTAAGLDVANGMNVSNNYGDIFVGGNIRGASKAESNCGNIDFELAGAETDYHVTAECNAGDVAIGTMRYDSIGKGHFEGRGLPTAPNKLAIEANFGDIKVSFGG